MKEKDAELEKLKADNTRLNKEAQKYFEITVIQSKQYSEELEKKNKMIDEMAKYIEILTVDLKIPTGENMLWNIEEIKQYFEKKVE